MRRSYCEWDSGNNEITLRKFVCSREGFREEKELKREIRSGNHGILLVLDVMLNL